MPSKDGGVLFEYKSQILNHGLFPSCSPQNLKTQNCYGYTNYKYSTKLAGLNFSFSSQFFITDSLYQYLFTVNIYIQLEFIDMFWAHTYASLQPKTLPKKCQFLSHPYTDFAEITYISSMNYKTLVHVHLPVNPTTS